MRAKEFIKEDDTILDLSNVKIPKVPTNEKAKAWIKKVYELYPYTFQNNHVMTWGEGDNQQIAMFELVPNPVRKNAVEVKWFQAYQIGRAHI
mgnify:FL=1